MHQIERWFMKMKNYFNKIQELIISDHVKELTEEQICNLAAYGLVKQLNDYSDLLFIRPEKQSIKFYKPLFHFFTPDILYVRMYDFSDESLQYFEEYINILDICKLKCILDLRRNVGGKLECAITFLKYFLQEKKIVELRYRNHTESYYTEYNDQFFVSAIVIIDNATASASEVVAGSIQYYNKGLLIGQRSCGKSSVQSLINIEDNIVLKLTVAYFYINGEYDINHKGLEPDIQFRELTEIFEIQDIDDFRIGQVDYKIAVIQQCLKELNLYDKKCNGIYDTDTIEAITEFNRRQKLDCKKVLSNESIRTLKKVYSEFCYNNIDARIIRESLRILMEK